MTQGNILQKCPEFWPQTFFVTVSSQITLVEIKKMKIKDALKCFIEYNLFFFVSLVVTHHYKKNCIFSKYYQLYQKYALNC